MKKIKKTLLTFFIFALPFLLTGVVYKLQRPFVKTLIDWAGGVRVKEPYIFDLYFFGINTPQGELTPNEWLQIHTHPLLDAITGFFYLTFIFLFIAYALCLRFQVSNKACFRLTWAFFAVNVLGYITYYLYPAAPPWYVALYGLGPARLDVGPSAGGAIRFDELLNINVFKQMYSQGESVFGAIPSLHNAYPMLTLIFSYRYQFGIAFAWIYVLAMAFSAVYLNHHYLLDIFWGWAYALLIGFIFIEKQSTGAREN